ncbi:MAG TPA: hypothetical protein VGE28_05405 [Pseudomonas sp.]
MNKPSHLVIALIIGCSASLAYADDDDGQRGDCLRSTALAPNIVYNGCSYIVQGMRCRSGAAIARCLNTSDASTVVFYPSKNLNNVLLNSDGIPRSETIYCRLNEATVAVSDGGTAYCKRR